MNPLAIHDPAARDALNTVLYVWVGLEVVFRLRNRSADRRTDWTLPVLAVAVGGAIAFAYRADGVPETVLGGGWAPFAIGLSPLFAGILVRAWAIVTLGRFFTPVVSIQPEHRVVRSGPYRFVRHPSYAGGLLALIGLGIVLDDWLSLVVLLLVPLAGVLIRIRHEEAALSEALGDDYRDYAASTPRLVPRLW